MHHEENTSPEIPKISISQDIGSLSDIELREVVGLLVTRVNNQNEVIVSLKNTLETMFSIIQNVPLLMENYKNLEDGQHTLAESVKAVSAMTAEANTRVTEMLKNIIGELKDRN